MERKGRRFLGWVVLIPLVIIGSHRVWSASADGPKVLAKGDGIVVTSRDVVAVLALFPKWFQLPRDEVVRLTLRRKLFSKAAERRGLDKDPDFLSSLSAYRDQLLNRLYFQDVILPKKGELTDKELLSYYRAHLEEFTIPGSVTLQWIALKDEATAREVKRALEKKDNFADLWKRFSVKPLLKQESSKIGPIALKKLAPALRKALKGAKRGEMVGPVESGGLWYILKVDSIRGQEVLPFKKVKKDIMVKLGKKREKELVDKEFDRLKREYHVTILQ